MTDRAELFYGTYGNFSERVLADIRAETFGHDLGQNSWVTAGEYQRFVEWLALRGVHHVLEVASGSGGPAVHLAQQAGCRVTGVDRSEEGVAAAARRAEEAGLAGQVRFLAADATARLPFADGTFDALLCVDAMNHFPDRASVLLEWRRVLRPGGRATFTDPVVITGPVTNDELAVRSSIGLFVFVPPEVTVRSIEEAGLRVLRTEDLTANAATVSQRWHRAREARREPLLQMEGPERYEAVQRFLWSVHTLTRERRLSRIAWVMERPAG
jgi:SAM-dependent methyltransferase